jgi:hypothetical protein
MEIKREMQGPTKRSWSVRVGDKKYQVEWEAESPYGQNRWSVQVLAKSRYASYWRSIRGLWIIREIRNFEGDIAPA